MTKSELELIDMKLAITFLLRKWYSQNVNWSEGDINYVEWLNEVVYKRNS